VPKPATPLPGNPHQYRDEDETSHWPVVVIPLLVIFLILSLGLYLVGGYQGGSATFARGHSLAVVNTADQPVGPGFAEEGQYNFTVPRNATSAWLNGSFAVSGCGANLYYCFAYVELLTPAAWGQIQGGTSPGTGAPVVWCHESGGTCLPQTSGTIASGDLIPAGYAGQPLVLAVYGPSEFTVAYNITATLTWETIP
jgi:hypothetical protein